VIEEELSVQPGMVESIKERAQQWLDDKEYGLIIE